MSSTSEIQVGDITIPVHSAYERNAYNWTLCRDAVEGESAIKNKGELYLPMPAAMSLPGSQPPSMGAGYDMTTKVDHGDGVPFKNNNMFSFANPNYHPNRAYSAYLTRAQFPELTSFILRGLLGLAFTDDPTVKLPKSMEYLLGSASVTGQSLMEYYGFILMEVLTTGRILSAMDIVGDQLKFAPYKTESVPNWKVSRTANSAAQKPLVIVVTEFEDTTTDYTDFEKWGEAGVVRYLFENFNGDFSVRTQRDPKELGEIIVPDFRGKTFPGIPAKMFAPVENSFRVQSPPLYGVASSSVQIYMKNADLSNSEFMSCSPTLVISGVDQEFKPKAIGSTVALILPDAEAKAYFTETDTSALTHVLSHISDLYEQAIYSGAQLLDSSKKAAESAETTRLKQSSSGATLISTVKNVAKGMKEQLQSMALWMGEDPNKVDFLPVTEFMAPALTAQEQNALVESWVKGAMSIDTLLENFRRAGLLQEGESVEDEIKRIQQDNASRPTGTTETD